MVLIADCLDEEYSLGQERNAYYFLYDVDDETEQV